jgi:hypothetical protein
LPDEPGITWSARTERGLNPVGGCEDSVERFGWRFQIRDKVIQTENDYDKEDLNGDIGSIGGFLCKGGKAMNGTSSSLTDSSPP